MLKRYLTQHTSTDLVSDKGNNRQRKSVTTLRDSVATSRKDESCEEVVRQSVRSAVRQRYTEIKLQLIKAKRQFIRQ